jgi:hypothetical protein
LLLLRVALLLLRVALLLLRVALLLSLPLGGQSGSRCVIGNLLITSSTLLCLPLESRLRIQSGFLLILLFLNFVAGCSSRGANNDGCSEKGASSHRGGEQRRSTVLRCRFDALFLVLLVLTTTIQLRKLPTQTDSTIDGRRRTC